MQLQALKTVNKLATPLLSYIAKAAGVCSYPLSNIKNTHGNETVGDYQNKLTEFLCTVQTRELHCQVLVAP